MNYRHIARVYLGWFDQEAQALCVSDSTGGSSLIWSPDGSFVVGYTGEQGFRTYQDFVRSLAQARLGEAQARRVFVEAVSLATGVSVR